MSHPLTIRLAFSIAEIEQCFPIMSQLRLHLKADNFIQQVRSQMTAGYRLAYLSEGKVVAVAGFSIATCLAWRKYLYVADLVVDENRHSKGYGEALSSVSEKTPLF